MARIFCEEDCGNAPKKAILRDFNIAIANKDLDYLLEWISDDVVWNKVGQSTATGKAQVADAFREIVPAEELVIESIITHGWHASAHGTLLMPDGAKYAYCDVYKFKGAARNSKIKSITSYVIQVH